MFRRILFVAVLILAGARVSAQGVLGDVFSGKLINPEVGVWAGYELVDAASGAKFYLRQAIVAGEEVKRKPGYWVETEVRPMQGFPMIYKMLLTGPANDPKNIHQLIVKEGNSAPQSVPVPQDGYAGNSDAQRTLVGQEKVKIGSGEEVDSTHYSVGDGDAKADIWLNDTVHPLGIVKMTSKEGQLTLQRMGTGGPESRSLLDAYNEELQKNGGAMAKPKVEVRVNGAKRDDTGSTAATTAPAPEAAPQAAPVEDTAKDAAKPKPGKKGKGKEKSK